MPGLELSWAVSVTDDHNKVLPDAAVSLQLVATAGEGKVVHACREVLVSVADVECPGMQLPGLGQHTLVATFNDPETGVLVTAEYSVGKTAQQWTASPLEDLAPWMSLQQEEEAPGGPQVVLRFRSYFTQAKLLLSYGSGDNTRRRLVAVEVGDNVIRVPLLDEGGQRIQACRHGCGVLAILSVPEQGDEFVSLFAHEGLAVASRLDLRAPLSASASLAVHAEDQERELEVKVAVSVESALPGSSVEIALQLLHPDTQQALTGEVAVIVVDQAFLDVEPHPLRQLDQLFQLPGAPQGTEALADDNRQQLGHAGWEEANVMKFLERHAMDPWVTPEWQWRRALLETSDEDFFSDKHSQLTRFGSGAFRASPPGKGFNEHWAGYGGGFGGGFDMAGYGGGGDVMYAVHAPIPMLSSMAARGGSMKARGAPVPAMAMEMSMQMDMDMGASSPSSAPSSAPVVAEIPVRTRFETTPLFLGRHTISGNGTVTLTLPDTIGRFSVRVYAVSAEGSRFGQAETSVVSSKPVAMQPLFPRFTRMGDRFSAGVVVQADDASFDGQVVVGAQSLAGTVSLSAVGSQAVAVRGTTPVKVRLDMLARALGCEMIVR